MVSFIRSLIITIWCILILPIIFWINSIWWAVSLAEWLSFILSIWFLRKYWSKY
jgi:Na+-driven multidrug efflux pump